MSTLLIWIAALVIGLALFLPVWKRVGPVVLKATESHPLQIAAMSATLAVLVGVAASILTALAKAL